MGQFGKQLLDAAASGITSGITGGISTGLSGVFNSIFNGPKKQARLQKELQENAARINYEYGEKAADNSFKRQLQMYLQSYKDNSYEAMVRQMEAAGLNPGMMYGMGGESGGGAGSTSGAPMGATGSSGAGQAANPAQTMAAEAAAVANGQKDQMIKLERERMVADIVLKGKQAGLTDAEIDETLARAGLHNAMADKTRKEAEWTGEKMEAEFNKTFQEGKAVWIKNLHSEFDDQEIEFTYNEDTGEIQINDAAKEFLRRVHHYYGEYEIHTLSRSIISSIYEMAKNRGQAIDAKAKAVLNSKKAETWFQEVANDTMKAIAAANNAKALQSIAETKAREFRQKFGIDEPTWFQWTELLGPAIINAGGQAAGAVIKAFFGKGKNLTPPTRSEGRVPTVYGADGTPVITTKTTF